MKRLNTFKLPRKVAKDDDEDELFPQKLGYSYTQEVRTQVTVHLNQPFLGPDYYDNIVDALDRASPVDVFIFNINSPGGRFDGLVSLLDAIENTEALVIGNIVGEAASAASIFALKCHQLRVSPYGEMLAHSSRYGFVGKSADNVSHVLHTAKVTDRVMREAYEGFLSEEEIEQVLNGKELYLDAEEIMQRLEAREEYFESLQEECNCDDDDCNSNELPERQDFNQEDFFEEVVETESPLPAKKVPAKKVSKKKE